jgi:predicted HTH domain antitoxin
MNLKEKILTKLSELDILILALFNANNASPIRDELFLQKEMFLVVNFIKEMMPSADFIPHIFGAYSEPVEISSKNLMAVNLIEKTPKGYQITNLGKEIFEKTSQKIPVEKKEAVEDFKEFLNDLSRDELLVFIYVSYPNMAKPESSIYEETMQKRIPASVSMYKDGKISLEKAAFLSGLPIERFIDLLR